MIRIKTASNETKEITKVYVKTGASTVQSISEAYQVYDDNGVKALKRVFGYSPNNVVAPTLVAWADHDENGQSIPWICVKVTPVDAADTIELSFVQYYYQEAKGEPYWFEWKPDPEGNGDYWFDAANCATEVLVKARSKRNGVYSSENTQMVDIGVRDCDGSEGLDENHRCIICGTEWPDHTCYNYRYEPYDSYTHEIYCACGDSLGIEECTFDDDTHECKHCYNPDPDYEAECSHTGGTATCKAQAVCSKCREPYGSLADHTEVIDAAVAATCTTAGKTEGKHCRVCNKVLVAQNSVPAKGHTPNKGWWTDGQYGSHWHSCSDCKQRYDTASHSYGAWTPSTIRANQHYKECTVCKLGDADIYEQCSYVTYRAATCTDNRIDKCNKCGRTVEQGGTKTAHDYSICTHSFNINGSGTYTAECDYCGDTKTGGIILDEDNLYQKCPNCGKTFSI